MKGQIKSGLLAAALTALLAGLALPGLAQADVKVTVLAAEYNDNTLVASVLAVATEGEDPHLWTVALSVGGTIEEDVIFDRIGARLWKIVNEADVVEPGDTLTATVAGFSDSANCGRGLPRLHITTICK